MEWRGKVVTMSALIREHLFHLEVGQSVEITEIKDRLGMSVSLDYVRVALHRWRKSRRFTANKTETGINVTRIE